MPSSLSIIATVEKAKKASSNPWIILLDLELSDQTLYFARNNEDVIFGGHTYQAWPIEIDSVTQEASTQVPRITLRVSNHNLVLSGYLEDYGGAVGATVTLRVVNMANLAGEPDLDIAYQALAASAPDGWATFVLGAKNLLRRKFPPFPTLDGHCPLLFNSPAVRAALDVRGELCGYQGADVTCDHTLNGANGCAVKNNQQRFGGAPGIGSQGWRSTSIV